MIYGHVPRRQQEKPHLYRQFGMWYCEIKGRYEQGTGNTANEAWQNWYDNMFKRLMEMTGVRSEWANRGK